LWEYVYFQFFYEENFKRALSKKSTCILIREDLE